ncbi:hypothetical protein CC2G_003338 [Coprinopsis cinerea AmutBmut pab1-1]|nr:hypothetical protein CC2G_003338 [Coprinopsis cinerea AmutBmut pab1-1]
MASRRPDDKISRVGNVTILSWNPSPEEVDLLTPAEGPSATTNPAFGPPDPTNFPRPLPSLPSSSNDLIQEVPQEAPIPVPSRVFSPPLPRSTIVGPESQPPTPPPQSSVQFAQQQAANSRPPVIGAQCDLYIQCVSLCLLISSILYVALGGVGVLLGSLPRNQGSAKTCFVIALIACFASVFLSASTLILAIRSRFPASGTTMNRPPRRRLAFRTHRARLHSTSSMQPILHSDPDDGHRSSWDAEALVSTNPRTLEASTIGEKSSPTTPPMPTSLPPRRYSPSRSTMRRLLFFNAALALVWCILAPWLSIVEGNLRHEDWVRPKSWIVNSNLRVVFAYTCFALCALSGLLRLVQSRKEWQRRREDGNDMEALGNGAWKRHSIQFDMR